VHLARGEVDEAIPLYEAALALGPSPVLLFNLAHAYGVVARLDEQDAALGRAQALDPGVVGELTALEATPGEPLSIDLPVPVQALRARALAGEAGRELSASLRRGLAPGVLGAGSTSIALSLLVVGLLACAAGRRFEPTRFCRECGARSCPRCDDPPPGLAVCRDCARIPHRPGDAQASERRSERRAALAKRRSGLVRRRRLASALVPGAAGLVARRPWLVLAGACAFTGALAASPVGLRPLVDPLAAGDAGRWMLGASALVLAVVHALVASAAWSRGEG
jgi:tetratricopeptide (TPR) repeat protein